MIVSRFFQGCNNKSLFQGINLGIQGRADWPAIKACKRLGRSFTTAIHFILKLASDGRLEKVMALEKLEKLSRYGRYSGRIMEDAIGRVKGGR